MTNRKRIIVKINSRKYEVTDENCKIHTFPSHVQAKRFADDQDIQVKSLMSGKLVTIKAGTPLCCNPASETYWSM